MAQKIEIKKRRGEQVVGWSVPYDTITPNTVINLDSGLTALIRIGGVTKVQTRPSATVISLFRPGKVKKVLGGNKPYKDTSIFAIDQSGEFDAEWGLGGNTAIPCRDNELEIDCHAVTHGNYFYKIENFVNFANAMDLTSQSEITREQIREFLREEISGIAKSYLTQVLAKTDIKQCQSHLSEYAEALKKTINEQLGSKGITVYNFVISGLEYDVSHDAVKNVFDGAKLDVKLKKIRNEGNRDDLSVAKDAAEIGIAVIKAEKGIPDAHVQPLGEKADTLRLPDVATKETVLICPRCGEKNKNANYCTKCGQKL